MKSGIYKILNKSNGKCYIGSSCNLNKRKYQHFNSLMKNKHYNLYLQKSFNKYGKDNFEFIVLCKCDESQLIELEQFYINKIKPEYNAVLTAGRTTGYKFTKEQREHQSNIRGVSIVRIDLNTSKIIDEWKSALIACKTLGFNHSTSITACCKNKIPSAYGYYWRYKSESDNYTIPKVTRAQPKDKTLIKKAVELYNNGMYIKDISIKLKIAYHVIYYHLR